MATFSIVWQHLEMWLKCHAHCSSCRHFCWLSKRYHRAYSFDVHHTRVLRLFDNHYYIHVASGSFVVVWCWQLLLSRHADDDCYHCSHGLVLFLLLPLLPDLSAVVMMMVVHLFPLRLCPFRRLYRLAMVSAPQVFVFVPKTSLTLLLWLSLMQLWCRSELATILTFCLSSTE